MPEKLDDSILGENEKFLIYGNPGTGKTHLAGTAPGPIYFLVIGPKNEIKTLRGPAFTREHGLVDVSFDQVIEPVGKRGMFMDASGFDMASDKLDEALLLREKGDLHFNTLVVDNATVLQEYQMNKAMEFNFDTVKSKSKSGMGKLRDHNIRIPGDNDYMSQMSLMDQFVNWLMKLELHVVFIAHEHTETHFDRASRQTSITAIKPLFTGKQRTSIPRAFDNVWRTSVSGSGRATIYDVQTSGSDNPDTIAKTRVGGVLKQSERNLNLTEAIKRLQNLPKK
jgi:hypothetical protein